MRVSDGFNSFHAGPLVYLRAKGTVVVREIRLYSGH
jgi:hypothetical protein